MGDDGAGYFLSRLEVGGAEQPMEVDEPLPGDLDAQQLLVKSLHEEFEPMVCEMGGGHVSTS